MSFKPANLFVQHANVNVVQFYNPLSWRSLTIWHTVLQPIDQYFEVFGFKWEQKK